MAGSIALKTATQGCPDAATVVQRVCGVFNTARTPPVIATCAKRRTGFTRTTLFKTRRRVLPTSSSEAFACVNGTRFGIGSAEKLTQCQGHSSGLTRNPYHPPTDIDPLAMM